MLQEWLKSVSPPPTWSGLVKTLSSAPVGEKRLAEEIREQYCGQQATGPSPGEVCVHTFVEVLESKEHLKYLAELLRGNYVSISELRECTLQNQH